MDRLLTFDKLKKGGKKFYILGNVEGFMTGGRIWNQAKKFSIKTRNIIQRLAIAAL